MAMLSVVCYCGLMFQELRITLEDAYMYVMNQKN